MKTWCLVILSFLLLYNPKVGAELLEIEGRLGDFTPIYSLDPFYVGADKDLDPNSIEGLEYSLDQINLPSFDKENPNKTLNTDVKNFAITMRIMKNIKNHNIALAQKILTKLENKNTLSGDDLYQIKKGVEAFAKASKLLLTLGENYQLKNTAMSRMMTSKRLSLKVLKAQGMWLLSNILVMDSTDEIHKLLYLNNSAFRRIFKSTFDSRTISKEEAKTLNDLTDLVEDVMKTVESKKFLQQVVLARSIPQDINQTLGFDADSLSIYDEIFYNSISKQISQGRTDFHLQLFKVEDTVVHGFNRITNLLSGVFGNIAGSVKWRKGYLYQNSEIQKRVEETLRPMDIILEKSYYTLTDKFIPGHYGHVALYLGTKEQLQKMEMWDHPQIIPYQKDIENGYTILEAVRSNVRLNTVHDFLNVDEYTIIRKNDSTSTYLQAYEQITRGMQQIGKAYDFNFDISTLDKIVCSELIYIVFGNVNWPTMYRLGRPTITPDDIAEILFRKNTPFIMTDYVASSKRHTFGQVNMNQMAEIFDYELRSADGSSLKDPKDPENSFWKKETKCYTVFSDNWSNADKNDSKKVCKTSYRIYVYEEQGR